MSKQKKDGPIFQINWILYKDATVRNEALQISTLSVMYFSLKDAKHD